MTTSSRAIVERAVESTGATGMPQMGLVMKAAQVEVAGRADGGRVAAVVKQVLAGPLSAPHPRRATSRLVFDGFGLGPWFGGWNGSCSWVGAGGGW